MPKDKYYFSIVTYKLFFYFCMICNFFQKIYNIITYYIT